MGIVNSQNIAWSFTKYFT